jgi:DNA-binding MarR family transcriptional regulator
MKPAARPRGRTTEEVARALREIRRLVAALQRSARAVERRTGITNAQLFLLGALKAHEPLSLGELAAIARTQQSTASIVVQRLVRNRLVHRQRSAVDARRLVLSLTPQGRRAVRDAPTPPTTRLLEALQVLPPADRRALIRGLAALGARMGAGVEEPEMLFEAPAPTRERGRPRSPRARRSTRKT